MQAMIQSGGMTGVYSWKGALTEIGEGWEVYDVFPEGHRVIQALYDGVGITMHHVSNQKSNAPGSC